MQPTHPCYTRRPRLSAFRALMGIAAIVATLLLPAGAGRARAGPASPDLAATAECLPAGGVRVDLSIANATGRPLVVQSVEPALFDRPPAHFRSRGYGRGTPRPLDTTEIHPSGSEATIAPGESGTFTALLGDGADLSGSPFTVRVGVRSNGSSYPQTRAFSFPACPPPANGLEGGVVATFDVQGETFRVWVTNPDTIQQLFALQAGTGTASIPNGRIEEGPGQAAHNVPWSWHLDPQDIELADQTIELCDGTPSYVEAHLDGFVDIIGRYCPWTAVLVGIEDYR